REAVPDPEVVLERVAAAVAIADLEDVGAEHALGEQVFEHLLARRALLLALHHGAKHVIEGHQPAACVDLLDDAPGDARAILARSLVRWTLALVRRVVDRARVDAELVQVVPDPRRLDALE